MKKINPENLHDLANLTMDELARVFPLTHDDCDLDDEHDESISPNSNLKEFLDAFDTHENKIKTSAFAPVVAEKNHNPLHPCVRYGDPEVAVTVYFRPTADSPVQKIDGVIGAKISNEENNLVARLSDVPRVMALDAPQTLSASTNSPSPSPESSIHRFRVRMQMEDGWNLIAAELHEKHVNWSADAMATVSDKPSDVVARRVALLSCTKTSKDEYELMTNAQLELLSMRKYHLVFRISKEG